MNFQFSTDRCWVDKDTKAEVWGSRQTTMPQTPPTNWSMTEAGRGFSYLRKRFPRSQLLLIGSYLLTQGVTWPTSADLKMSVNGVTYEFRGREQLKALYYVTAAVAQMTGSGSTDTWVQTVPADMTDDEGQWSKRRIYNHNNSGSKRNHTCHAVLASFLRFRLKRYTAFPYSLTA